MPPQEADRVRYRKSEGAMSENSNHKRHRRLRAAQGYLELEMPTAALEQLDAIAEPHDAALTVHCLRGEALRQKSDWDAALKAYQKAILDSPRNVAVLMAMAWCFKRTGDLPRAITAMERAYQIDPKEPIILYNLSCYFALAGDKPNTLSWLGRAIRMDPGVRDLIAEESDFDGLRCDSDFLFVTTDAREA